MAGVAICLRRLEDGVWGASMLEEATSVGSGVLERACLNEASDPSESMSSSCADSACLIESALVLDDDEALAGLELRRAVGDWTRSSSSSSSSSSSCSSLRARLRDFSTSSSSPSSSSSCSSSSSSSSLSITFLERVLVVLMGGGVTLAVRAAGLERAVDVRDAGFATGLAALDLEAGLTGVSGSSSSSSS